MGKPTTSYDFSGYVTKANVRCSDGLTIAPDAFKANDGKKVPLVWGHDHKSIDNVIGHCYLENRDDGVYGYGVFNDSKNGQMAKLLVQHGDIDSMSVYANQLNKTGGYVNRGNIREVSLVLAGANPKAFIDEVLAHGEQIENEAVMYFGEDIELYHSDKPPVKTDDNETKEDKPMEDAKKKPAEGEETVEDVWNTLNEKQKKVCEALIGLAMEEGANSGDDDKKEGGNTMKHNIFEDGEVENGTALCHDDEVNIINLAKSSSVGNLRDAIEIYAEQNNSLSHAFEDMEALFPEYKDVRSGVPELIRDDESWVSVVMQKTTKSPISRIRTRLFDARSESIGDTMRALGYKKSDEKKYTGKIKQIKRTTDPQTVYIKDKLERDDITDITDFDVVNYMYGVLRQNLHREVALATLIGDGRDDGDENKISEEHIRSIWHDDELYTIHKDVDIEAAKKELQGTNTGANFGENYIYAESIITAALYSREKYKGSGSPDLFCTPHLVNVMLLARDLNGRRIYNSISEIATALNVKNIYTVEQFAGKTRTDDSGKQHKLLGLLVNLADYQHGSTKGGQISQFNQFDIDFNQEKYLIETRLSGSLTRVFSAIALEEPVAAGSTD